jgi:hypothetical protein
MWMKRRRTAEEQQIVDWLVKTHGREYAERHAELAIEQAKAIGELPDFDDSLFSTWLVAASPTVSELMLKRNSAALSNILTPATNNSLLRQLCG